MKLLLDKAYDYVCMLKFVAIFAFKILLNDTRHVI